MATINLGSIKFNWKGAFNNSTAYAVDDVVSSSGNSYVCIQASQGNAVGNATAYWNIMSAAGAAGAEGGTSTLTTRGDLLTRGSSAVARLAKGTEGQVLGQGANDPIWVNGSAKTLTTRGDILYRDASGLQRLAKGTAGHFLKQGSQDPEWGAVAAGGLIQTANAFKIDVQSFSYNSGRVVVSGLNVTLPNSVASSSKLFISGHLTCGGEATGDPGVSPRWEYSTNNSSWSELQRTTFVTSGHAAIDANANVGNSMGYDGWSNNQDVKHASWSTMCTASQVSQARYYRVTVRQTDSTNDSVKINSGYAAANDTGYAPTGNSSLVVMEMGV